MTAYKSRSQRGAWRLEGRSGLGVEAKVVESWVIRQQQRNPRGGNGGASRPGGSQDLKRADRSSDSAHRRGRLGGRKGCNGSQSGHSRGGLVQTATATQRREQGRDLAGRGTAAVGTETAEMLESESNPSLPPHRGWFN